MEAVNCVSSGDSGDQLLGLVGLTVGFMSSCDSGGPYVGLGLSEIYVPLSSSCSPAPCGVVFKSLTSLCISVYMFKILLRMFILRFSSGVGSYPHQLIIVLYFCTISISCRNISCGGCCVCCGCSCLCCGCCVGGRCCGVGTWKVCCGGCENCRGSAPKQKRSFILI